MRKLAVPVAGAALVVLIGGSVAQTAPANATVDLSVGPVAVNAQAVNIALALSVEFPTVGSAYRKPDYNATIEYLGYFDNTGCYAYKDVTTGAPMSGEYWFRTGSVDSNGYCNDATTAGAGRYSGNALNYITTSSIDLLRYALTGGNRVYDTASTTILERAYLYNTWKLHDSNYFPAKRIPVALVGKVIPALNNGDVYGGGCKDKVWFGKVSTSVDCDTAGSTTSGNLNPTSSSGTVTVTLSTIVRVPKGSAAPTGGVYQTTTWDISNPVTFTSTAPGGGSPVDPRDTPTRTGNETYATPPAPITLAQAFIRNDPVVSGTSTSIPTNVTGTYRNPIGTTNVPFASRYFLSTAPANPYRTLSLPKRSGQSDSVRVCIDNTGNSFKGLLDSSGVPTDVPNNCGVNPYAGFANRARVTTSLPRTVYEPLDTINTYNTYTLRPVYYEYTVVRDYRVYNGFDEYEVTTAGTGTRTVTTTGVVYARVRVCDDAEKTLRTDLCTRYPNGNYKPVGEVQRYATGTRVAAFGYLAEDGTGRYGGVLRAPMKYPGPNYLDPAGQSQTNAQTEWDANDGVFKVDPQGEAPTFATSGVINYLNKFGTTGATKGYYKSNDPVGEMYYEVLRYFQGLGPTASATSGMTATSKDGFPVSTTWTDPLQNACERRNFILTIGDVNTHADKQLPGHKSPNGVNETTVDPARAAVSIPGSTKTFDAVYWTDLLTGFETGTSPRTYIDAWPTGGRSQTTAGNPNPNSNNSALSTTATGSGGSSAYYWAGAAYWANTQPIRLDSKAGQSMKEVRVKTFTIDVDEGGDGSIEDTNIRGIKPRRSSFYLAGKYGWFNDVNLDGNPFKTGGGRVNNTEWEDKSAPNTPDGYVIVSQAQKLIDGIRKFFQAASSERGAVSVSAISTARFTLQTLNGDIFTPKFNPAEWSGTVEKSGLVLNTTTGTVESTQGIVWDTGSILTSASTSASATLADPYVKPANRNIITLSTDSGTAVGVAFNVANKASLDLAVRNALSTDPQTGTTDTMADLRINWLRGDRSSESSSSLRVRGNIMGDVINSGPVYKQDADTEVSGTGYLAYAQSVKSRAAVLYVGANDGMMHAFRASDGKELFAYVPRMIAPFLNKLTNPRYTHRPYVDGVPLVGEAQVGTTWKTLLVSGLGGGAQGVFALDVSNPESFGAGNVMFEFSDADDADMGNVMTQPVLVKLKVPPPSGSTTPTYKWFIAVGSGYNNYKADGRASSTGAQAMFFLSVDKAAGAAWAEGTNYFKVVLPVADAAAANGLANPGFVTGLNGEATLLYAGDLQGNVWKFDLSSGINSANIANAVFKSSGVLKPMFVATETDAGTARQPITTSPQVVAANKLGYMVVFGTGKFVEPSDSTTAQQQSIYGIWDSLETTAGNFTVARNKLFNRTATLTGTTVSLSTPTFTFGKASGEYRGWKIDLPETRERIAVEPALGVGVVAFKAAIPDGTCSGDGTGREYCVNPVYGNSVCGDTSSSPGIPSGPKLFQYELDVTSYSARTPTGRRSVSIEQQVISSSTKITQAGNALVAGRNLQSISIPAGRLSWRELRN